MATMMEFEQSLDSQLPPELWPQAKPLAELLAGACTGGIADDEIQRRLAGQPGLAPVLRALANKEIRVDGTSLMISMLPTMVAASPTPTLAQDNRVAIIVNKGSAEAITAFNVQQNEYTNVTMTLSGTRVDASAPPLIVRCPTLSPPPEPLTFYDRSEPLDRIAAQLKLRHGVWLAGQPGCGMTSLLEKAANLKPARGFARRDGVVYLDGWLEPRDSDDLAQSLYNRFFMRADGAAVRLQPQATRAALGQMKALFVLDRPRLEREQLIGLARDLASAGSVLVATDDPGAPWLAQLEVAALPQEDARRVLVEAAQLGGAQPETLALADRLCAALDNLPLALTIIGRLIRRGRAPDLAALADEAEALRRRRPEALYRAAALALKALDEPELAALRALVGGLPAGGTIDTIASLCQIAEEQLEVALYNLAQLGLVYHSGERYTIATNSLRAALGRLVAHEAERKRAVPAFAALAVARFGDTAWLEHEWVNLLQAARTALSQGQANEAASLLRAIQPHVTEKGLWQSWGRVIDMAGRAAQQSGDPALRAWVLHEQGTQAGLLGDLDRAAESLARAHQLRVELGDHVGAELTQHNIEYFNLLVPPQSGEPEPADSPAPVGPATGPAWLMPLALALVALVAIGVGVIAMPRINPLPTIRIASPQAGQRFRPGETIALRASAADAQEQPLPAEALEWAVTLRSPSGDQDLATSTAGGELSVTVPAQVDLATASGGYLEIVVAATDDRGRRGQETVRMDAVKAPLALATEPPGFALAINGEQVATPYSAELWSGVSLELSAPDSITHQGQQLRFEGWSDGTSTPRRPLRTGDDGQNLIAVFGMRIVNCEQSELETLENAGEVALAVSLDKPSSEPVVVDYRVEALGAAAGGDFRLNPGTLTFQPGQVTLPISVTIAEDAVDEPAERLAVQLAPRAGAMPGSRGRCELTIVDNDDPPTVAFAGAAYGVKEGAGSLAFEIQLDTASAYTATARIQARAETAEAGKDFAPLDVTLAFAPGEQRATATIAIIDDRSFEGAERLALSVEPLEQLRPGEPSRAYLTIEDDDAKPVLSLVGASPTGEGAGRARLTIASSQPLPAPLTLGLEIDAGSATPGEDFVLPASITMPAGAVSAPVDVQIMQDDLYEGDEDVALRLVLPASPDVDLGTASATLDIVEDEPRPVIAFSPRNSICDEPQAAGEGVRSLAMQQSYRSCENIVKLVSSVRAAQPISVEVKVEGDAVLGEDFTLNPVITFAPRAQEATLAWQVSADGLYEHPERAIFRLVLPDNSVAQPSETITATVLIISWDPKPSLRLEYPDEVSEDAGEVVVSAVLDHPSGVDASLVLETISRPDPQTYPRPARPGSDYEAKTAPLTIRKGATQAQLSVTIYRDEIAEGLESLVIQARDVEEANGPDPAIIEIGIRDNPPQVGFAPTDYTANESSPSQAAFAFSAQAQIAAGPTVRLTVRLAQVSAEPVTVDYATVSGSAVAGQDFEAASGSLTIAASQAEAQIEVTILSDGLYEGDLPETFQVVLSNAQGATLGAGTATITIVDSESRPTISFANTTYSVGEGSIITDTRSVSIDLVLSRPSAVALTVDLVIGGDSTATQGVDYSLSGTRVTFAPGVTVMTITVTTAPDYADELNETVNLSLADPGMAGDRPSCVVQINDDDNLLN